MVDLSACESFGDGGARILQAAVLDAQTLRPLGIVRPGQQLRIDMLILLERLVFTPGFGLLLKNRLGQPVFSLNNYFLDQQGPKNMQAGQIRVVFFLAFPSLTHGRYAFSLAVAEGTLRTHTQLHWVHDALCLDLVGGRVEHASDCLLALPRDHWTMHVEVDTP
jgi:lipopolysaccharide transport system ATP-binding protein